MRLTGRAPIGVALALATLVLFAPLGARAQVADMLARTGPAVVRVISSNCVGEDGGRSGSGFVWSARGHVVTALHVVAGCATVKVAFQGASESTARVEHSLRDADLAMLAVDNAPATAVLEAATDIPAPDETVYVYGYPLGIATRQESALRVVAANRDTPLLRQAVDEGTRANLVQLGSPSLDVQILRTDGNLLPGHSGAAVLDSRGRIVAIGSGGLQRGAVGIGWSIRARYLADLARSTEVMRNYTAADSIGSRFAVVTPTKRQEVQCGELTLVRTRTMKFADLAAQADDQRGLMQILELVQRSASNIYNLQYDVWVETKTGGAVAVLSGAPLQSGPQVCSVTLANGVVQVFVGGTSQIGHFNGTPWFQSVQAASVRYENAWSGDLARYLTREPKWSYNGPRVMRPGMIANRETFLGQMPNRPPHAAFQSLIAKDTTFLGVVAITHKFMTAPPLDEATYTRWYGSAIGVQLSSFPP